MSRDPSVRAKAVAGLRARLSSDPDFAASLRERARRASASRDIEAVRAKAMQTRFWEHAAGRRWADAPPGSEARRRAGARISAAKLAHIPTDYRHAYRALILKGVAANDAEAAIADQIETDRRRMRAAMMGAR